MKTGARRRWNNPATFRKVAALFFPDAVFHAGRELAVRIHRQRFTVMFMHLQSLITGAHGGKFRLAHGIERALGRWPDGVINGFPRGSSPYCINASFSHRTPAVGQQRPQGYAAAAVCLAVAVKVTVGGEDNLTGRVFLTGKARQRKEVHGRQRHHDGFPGQVMHGERGRIALCNPQAFSGLFCPSMTCMPFDLTALSGCV